MASESTQQPSPPKSVPMKNVLHGGEGFSKWMAAYRDADDDADIEIAIAESEQTDPPVFVRVSVDDLHMIMSPGQARVMAKAFREITNAGGGDHSTMVVGLMDVADRVEKRLSDGALEAPLSNDSQASGLK